MLPELLSIIQEDNT